MLLFTICSLVAGLLAVSAAPLDETMTELSALTTTVKPIPFEDVMEDSDVNNMMELLKFCGYQDPKMKFHREAMEDGLRDVMSRKKFSQHIEKVMFVAFMTRLLICPSPYSYLKESTATFSDNEVPVTQQPNEPNVQELSYNIPEPTTPFDLVDQSSDSHLGQSNESSSINNEVPVYQQSNGPNTQESSENLSKPLAERKDQQY